MLYRFQIRLRHPPGKSLPRVGGMKTYYMMRASAVITHCIVHESPTQSMELPRNRKAIATGHVAISVMLSMALTKLFPNLRRPATCFVRSWYDITRMDLALCRYIANLVRQSRDRRRAGNKGD